LYLCTCFYYNNTTFKLHSYFTEYIQKSKAQAITKKSTAHEEIHSHCKHSDGAKPLQREREKAGEH